MRIQNNITALNSHRQYGINNTNIAKSVEKLSSGYRINRAGDDAAGLAISEKMRGQIRGLNMASKNSQDAVSLIQTAEGALQSTHNILQRMRELAVQSATDTNMNQVDREALQLEFSQLQDEIDQTADKTEFNKMKLIDGSFGGGGGLNKTDAALAITNNFSNLNMSGAFKDGDTIAIGAFDSAGTAAIITVVIKEGGAGTVDATVTIAAASVVGVAILDQEGEKVGYQYSAQFKVNDKDYFINFSVNNTDSTTKGKYSDLVTASVLTTRTLESQDKVIQVGANKGDELNLSIAAMNTKSLGNYIGAFNNVTGANTVLDSESISKADTNISSRESASDAIKKVDNALNMVSMQRAALGAKQNRLEYKISNLDTSAENLQAAESRIRDVDMAKEMTNFMKNNILSQAATAMLGQANSLPQGVLSLLG